MAEDIVSDFYIERKQKDNLGYVSFASIEKGLMWRCLDHKKLYKTSTDVLTRCRGKQLELSELEELTGIEPSIKEFHPEDFAFTESFIKTLPDDYKIIAQLMLESDTPNRDHAKLRGFKNLRGGNSSFFRARQMITHRLLTYLESTR